MVARKIGTVLDRADEGEAPPDASGAAVDAVRYVEPLWGLLEVSPPVTGRKRKRAFLKMLAMTGSVRFSCRYAQRSRATVEEWLATDEKFAAEYETACTEATERLEDVALGRTMANSRALAGITDTLLMFLLKARRPEVYSDRERLVTLTGASAKAGERLADEDEQEPQQDLSALTDDELVELARLVAKANGETNLGMASGR
jgi:hypothetical protein